MTIQRTVNRFDSHQTTKSLPRPGPPCPQVAFRGFSRPTLRGVSHRPDPHVGKHVGKGCRPGRGVWRARRATHSARRSERHFDGCQVSRCLEMPPVVRGGGAGCRQFFSRATDRADAYCARVEEWRQGLEKNWLWRKCDELGISEDTRAEIWPTRVRTRWDLDQRYRELNREHPWA